MRILVTGGAGFIGSHVVDAYLKAGHRVWVVDNESTGRRTNVNTRAVYTKLDIADAAALRRYAKGKRFDVVNHHAAQIDVRRSVTDPAFDARVNILGMLNVLALCRATKARKILFSSSGGTIYGECRRPAPEDGPEEPLSPYGVSKLAGEKYIKAHAALTGLRYTILRYGNVYGPRQDPYGEAGVVAIFAGRLLHGQPCVVFGNGRQSRDFVYVGDVAQANRAALTRGADTVINIGTGRTTSVNQLYAAMAALTGGPRTPQRKPARAGELDKSVLNAGRAGRALGWRAETSLRDGLKETIGYFSSAAGASAPKGGDRC